MSEAMKEIKLGDTLYRYTTYRGVIGSVLVLDEYMVSHVTPRGCWISSCGDSKYKWVSSHSRKRYAYPTKLEALHAYKKRKERFLIHAKNMLRCAQDDLSCVDSDEKKEAALNMTNLSACVPFA